MSAMTRPDETTTTDGSGAPAAASARLAAFDWADPFRLDEELSDEERLIRDAAHDYCQGQLMPRVLEANRNETVDTSIFKEMGELGFLGVTVPETYGGAGASYSAYGLIAREVERVDSGYRSMMSVQSSLVMYPIYRVWRSQIQRRRSYLPKLASSGELGRLLWPHRTRSRVRSRGHADPRGESVEGGYRLTGTKMWISNSARLPMSFVVWAKGRPRQQDQAVSFSRSGMPGLSDAEDRGQVLAARLDHRR